MPLRQYKVFNFRKDTLAVIETANAIIAEYAEAGFDLTLRQLYYQFVARDLIPNKETSYKRLGSIINDARLAGLIDWLAISDRTRFLRGHNHSENPAEFVSKSIDTFHIDKWKNQPSRVEVWIEKDALVGVLESVCPELDVDYFSCRGYTSQSEMWRAAMRVGSHIRRGQRVVVLHLGDHDPSGIDMSRDIEDRLSMFLRRRWADDLSFERIALTMGQVDEVGAPPNPAKMTDARFREYQNRYGDESWELDALEPTYLADLVRFYVEQVRDSELWDEACRLEEVMTGELRLISSDWDAAMSAVTEGES